MVDTNDGDYHEEYNDITDISMDRVDKFLKVLGKLPVEMDYHYDVEGNKVETGNKVRFVNNVGNCVYYHDCGLKDLILPEGEFINEAWTTEEVYKEGFILQKDYKILEEFLPMYCDGGFHSIIKVTLEETTEPVVIKTFEL